MDNAVRKARASKPVVIYMGSLAASGGYYVSCGGSYLMANDTTLTGSMPKGVGPWGFVVGGALLIWEHYVADPSTGTPAPPAPGSSSLT